MKRTLNQTLIQIVSRLIEYAGLLECLKLDDKYEKLCSR